MPLAAQDQPEADAVVGAGRVEAESEHHLQRLPARRCVDKAVLQVGLVGILRPRVGRRAEQDVRAAREIQLLGEKPPVAQGDADARLRQVAEAGCYARAVHRPRQRVDEAPGGVEDEGVEDTART